jgi:acid ceramidase
MRALLLFTGPTFAWPGPVQCGVRATDPQYDAYVADASTHVPGWATLDLDAKPAERWTHLVQPKAAQLRDLIETFKDVLGLVSRGPLDLLEHLAGPDADRLVDSMTAEYAEELRGIANVTSIPLVDVLLFNIMDEFVAAVACTSIVVEDSDGNMLHGRNLDFGLFMGWNWTEHQWRITDKLRPLLVNLHVVRGGQTVYTATSFLGYIGMFTGLKRGAFSVTLDTRHDSTHARVLLDWITGKDRTRSHVTQEIRAALTEEVSFAAAVARLNTTKLYGTGYFILSGPAKGEAAVISRDADRARDLWTLDAGSQPWLLETNYDHWRPTEFFDNRQDYGNACMRDLVQNRSVSFAGLFQVLSSMPLRNRLTTYSVLMDVQTGRHEAYVQHCTEKNCPLWGEPRHNEELLVV